ncbi:chaperone NapD [Halomonas sp. ML-15]|uniref:chaperone NapD n=1 Tax=Halomonas sp. ML-15 TaxID=2773305 RepID=UPI0017473AE9|nr:chaperone NapD [Halomonas sp. ML-15]MBD3895572.1 chaperone NapD [Halomonas sp. ML-15]
MNADTLHIASFIVHVRPPQLAAVAAWLNAAAGCEVRGEDPAGKLVAVVESLEECRALDLIDRVQTRPGVLGAALVYHQLLDPATADEPHEGA